MAIVKYMKHLYLSSPVYVIMLDFLRYHMKQQYEV